MKKLITRYKLVILFFVLYLPFLGVMLYVYSGSPPDVDVAFYKGAPIGTSKEWSNVEQYGKADDLNIVRTTMGWWIDSKGNFHDMFFMKPIVIEHIQHAHRLGLKVYVSLRPQYSFGGPQGIPEDIRSIVMTRLKEKVLEWAEICEKYGVELFAPIQECEVLSSPEWKDNDVVDDEALSEWMQDIIDPIKERYHGEVVLGGGAWGGSARDWDKLRVEWKLLLDNYNIDFTGYDYIAFGPYSWHLVSPKYAFMTPDPTPEDYREYVRYSLNTLNEWAERDGCKGVLIREMGGPQEFYQVVFEEGENILKGIITTHWHWDRDFVGYWFRERLP
ncbi:hypothetical protein ACFLUL_00755 [Chloroflexota bacterium]